MDIDQQVRAVPAEAMRVPLCLRDEEANAIESSGGDALGVSDRASLTPRHGNGRSGRLGWRSPQVGVGGLVSFLVSFSYVRPGSPGHFRPCRRRSQTATTYGEHGPTDLESVLGKPSLSRETSARLRVSPAAGPGASGESRN